MGGGGENEKIRSPPQKKKKKKKRIIIYIYTRKLINIYQLGNAVSKIIIIIITLYNNHTLINNNQCKTLVTNSNRPSRWNCCDLTHRDGEWAVSVVDSRMPTRRFPPLLFREFCTLRGLSPLPVALNLLASLIRLCDVSSSDHRAVLSRVSAKLVYVIAILSSPSFCTATDNRLLSVRSRGRGATSCDRFYKQREITVLNRQGTQ